jgi:hypothetical protein
LNICNADVHKAAGIGEPARARMTSVALGVGWQRRSLAYLEEIEVIYRRPLRLIVRLCG